ncbi:ABC transporter permease [Peptoniphilus sp. AGMB00490]|uniref:ABC transporter permease n=1 Tax=Peptoniphilus faecalis TaxID=2731255 RepID=A0A848RG82_9FIRM|nr:ABC transporter permease [Peptoniphilus faecalis]NMW85035.1 ABC transporter permease [Peptoniphilus faecalis]
MIDFLLANSGEILSKSMEHLFIAAISLFFGVLIAVPLGIFLTRSKTTAKIVMAIASVLQTVPSFALLALMIPIFGVGKKPAIVSLFIYSLLPILRNTYLGIAGVNDKLIDAAKGMGMTRSQILLKVQIPMAMPVIMSGIRLSAIYVLAWTTLASYVGAGGLGDFIFNGLTNAIMPMVVWGTIPVTLMAIIVDFFFGILEDKLSPNKTSEVA